jgi:ATP-dependent Lon protease
MNAKVDEKQKMLEEPKINQRAQLLMKHLNKELQILELKNDIQSRVKTDLDQQQKEYFLHQQMKEIQNQLGENPVQQEINDLRDRSENKKME